MGKAKVSPVVKEDGLPKEIPLFNKEDLIKGAQHFNTTPEIMAGALTGINAPITEAEAKEKLEGFLNRPVNNEGGK